MIDIFMQPGGLADGLKILRELNVSRETLFIAVREPFPRTFYFSKFLLGMFICTFCFT